MPFVGSVVMALRVSGLASLTGSVGSAASGGVMNETEKSMGKAVLVLAGAAAAEISGSRASNPADRLGRLSGRLATAVSANSVVTRSNDEVIGLVGPGPLVYGRIHELGGIIRPVRARALVFEVGGKTVVTQQVVMPARPYLKPALDKRQADIAEILGDGLVTALRPHPGASD